MLTGFIQAYFTDNWPRWLTAFCSTTWAVIKK